MRQARAFFFVCVGLLCLAVAYHLGARSATAQAGGPMEGAGFTMPPQGTGYLTAAFAVNRVLYTSYPNPSTGQWLIPAQAASAGPIPGTASVAATYSPGGATYVLLANGDMYRAGSGTWVYDGNLLSGVVAAQRSTWGQVKAKYATPAPAKPTR